MGNINFNILDKKDAYIYKDNKDKFWLFIYIKSKNKNVRDNLDLSHEKYIQNIYLYSYFDEEFNDYVGQMNKIEIINTIKKLNCISLLKNDFRTIYNTFKINRYKYANIMKFIKKQLNVDI
jgi:hypothetical protein